MPKTPDEQLLNLKTPEYRKAYSDRTAWLMACISELVYIRFEPLIKGGFDEKRIIERLDEMLKNPKTEKMLKALRHVCYDHEENLQNLISELSALKFEIRETFDSKGTQAMLVSNGSMLVLAFRGTEPDRVKDIKSDLDGVQEDCSTSGSIHRGFSNAYEVISSRVVKELSKPEYSSLPLYITGHSLGGAIATVATKRLKHQGGHAATYTFGAPRVGNEDWVATIKTPVYRIVNSADIVPMLPPSGMTIDTIGWLTKLIPVYGDGISKWLLDNFSGYMHGGNMRFLSNCKTGKFSDVKLLYSVHFWRRVRALAHRLSPLSKLASDHSMSIYRRKLNVIARRRNNID
ncbi:lipase family protein [Endozoicomonas sp. G2_1]|uniref:lipase family protein n=1 Tax=Endozoicomonas sp. G2_1 TaxID=2821091 RepID=UPI001ADA55E4|nr:lipase family protein [Endozoicomonas sp. G2_1]MBO9489837.1 lipase family protein [Endozoicomonas sp. G2_1]